MLSARVRHTVWVFPQIRSKVILGILGIVLLVVYGGDGVTPGFRIKDTSKAIVQWGWASASVIRRQDDFNCSVNQICKILNLTINGTLWTGDPLDTGYQPTYGVHSGQGYILKSEGEML